jgi:hypothetical protein
MEVTSNLGHAADGGNLGVRWWTSPAKIPMPTYNLAVAKRVKYACVAGVESEIKKDVPTDGSQFNTPYVPKRMSQLFLDTHASTH